MDNGEYGEEDKENAPMEIEPENNMLSHQVTGTQSQSLQTIGQY